MISVTDPARKKITASLKSRGHGLGIRLGVKTTGCSGLAYVLEYVDTAVDTDHRIEFDTFAIFIDPKSMIYLTGMTVDYVRRELNEGFEFLNPNERDRCGCGESFRV